MKWQNTDEVVDTLTYIESNEIEVQHSRVQFINEWWTYSRTKSDTDSHTHALISYIYTNAVIENRMHK